MIRCLGVLKYLGGRAVLRGLELHVRAGETVSLFGPNGAGKSTLLRLIAGVTRPDGGEIRINGVRVDERTAAERGRLGMLGHQGYLYEHLSGEENLRFWARVYGVAGAEGRIRELLGRVGLRPFAGDPVRSYSRGMLQRLAIARAVLHDPDVLLLDEPFTGLDPAGVRMLAELLGELKARGRTLLIVSHRPEEVGALSHRFVVLAGGRIQEEVLAPGEGQGTDTSARAHALLEVLRRWEPAGGMPAGPRQGRPGVRSPAR